MQNKDITVLVPSWRGPELLKYFIPNILKSFTLDNELIIVLNEADKESIDICRKEGVQFIQLPDNKGTSAVDVAIPFIKGKYIVNSNDDFFFHKGWDTDLASIIGANYPCSASAFLVERFNTNNPTAYIDNIGLFNEETEKKFLENYEKGKYKNVMKRRVSYMHPIMVKTEDFLKVNGYSDNMDMNWLPGWSLDDWFPYRLWQLYNKKFKFIVSDKSCVYHLGSATNNKLPPNLKNKPNADYFLKKTGMTIQQFNQEIKRNWLIEHAYED